MPCADESQACKDARRDFDAAENERIRLHERIQNATDVRAGGAGLATLGAIVLAGVVVVSGPLGWIGAAAIGAVVVGGGTSVSSHVATEVLRGQCEAARQRMYEAYQRAMEACRDSACVPPRTWATPCP